MRARLLTLSLSLAIASIMVLLVSAAGDISTPLEPTAVAAAYIVSGGPDGSGRPLLWTLVFIALSLAVWTAIWLGILSLVILPLKKRLGLRFR